MKAFRFTLRPWLGLAPLTLLLMTGCGNTEAKLSAKANDSAW